MSLMGGGLAWNPDPAERQRLLVIASIIGAVFLGLAVYISGIKLPEPVRVEREILPPQLARLIVEKKEPPKPVLEKPPENKPELPLEKPEPKPVEKPVEKLKPDPVVVAKPKPPVLEKPRPEPLVVEQPKPAPKKPMQEPRGVTEPTPAAIEQARNKVKDTGILAMSNEIAKISALADSVQLDTPKVLTTEPGASKPADKLAVRAASPRSGGVDDRKLNQKTEQLALTKRERAKAEPSNTVVASVQAERQATRSQGAQRSKEELRRVMDANKSAIYSIYSRELRKQPSLRGNVTPELVIEQNGTVSRCSVVESSLNQPALEEKICNRLRVIDFGARAGVSQTTIRYPIELLPG